MANYIAIIESKFVYELWNRKNLAMTEELFTDDFVTEPIPFEQNAWHGQGPQSMRHHVQQWCHVMPDIKMQLKAIGSYDNSVLYHWEFRGTMTGPFFGIPPINKEVVALGFTISYFEGEKIKLNKTLWDKLHFMQQLNVLPALADIIQKGGK